MGERTALSAESWRRNRPIRPSDTPWVNSQALTDDSLFYITSGLNIRSTVASVESLLPYFKVATAVAPFLMAAAVRLVAGRNRLTGALLSLGTMWFAVNVLLSPFTEVSRFSSWLR